MVDSSKFGKVAFATVATLDQVQRVITDAAAPAEMLDALRDRGIGVLVV